MLEKTPTSQSQWGKFHSQHTLNTVLTDITNLISLRDAFAAGLKLVAQQMLLRQRIKPLELVIGRRKGFCLEEILSQDQCLERGR